MNRTVPYLIILLPVTAWCILIFIPPLLAGQSGNEDVMALASYAVFSPVCHQWDSHSLHLFGNKLGVCARCTAIYIGFFLGIFFQPVMGWLVVRRPALWLCVALLPMLVDAGLTLAGVIPGTMGARLATGGWFGMTAAVAVFPSLADASRGFISTFTRTQGTIYESQTR